MWTVFYGHTWLGAPWLQTKNIVRRHPGANLKGIGDTLNDFRVLASPKYWNFLSTMLPMSEAWLLSIFVNRRHAPSSRLLKFSPIVATIGECLSWNLCNFFTFVAPKELLIFLIFFLNFIIKCVQNGKICFRGGWAFLSQKTWRIFTLLVSNTLKMRQKWAL